MVIVSATLMATLANPQQAFTALYGGGTALHSQMTRITSLPESVSMAIIPT